MKEIAVSAALGGLTAMVAAATASFATGYPVAGSALVLIACVTAVAWVGENRKHLEEGFPYIRLIGWNVLRWFFEYAARDLESKQGWTRRVMAVVYLVPSAMLAAITAIGIFLGFNGLSQQGNMSMMGPLVLVMLLYGLAMTTIGVSLRALFGKAI